MHSRLFLMMFLLVCLTPAPWAQTRKMSPKQLPRSAFKLASIKVTGATHYTDRDIVAATGLQLGQTAGDDDFKKASQHLIETGLFTDVVYAFKYSSEGTNLEFQLTDDTKLVPARFDDFVWFSDQELLDKIRARVPLFKGELPIGGSLPEEVSDALQGMLIERNVQGHVDYLRSGADDRVVAIVYSVSGPSIHIGKVSFEGAGQEELPALERVSAKLTGLDYSRATLRVRAEKDLLPVYLERGYLKTMLGQPLVKIAKDSPEETIVDLTFPVTRGRQYTVEQVQLTGTKAISADEIQKLLQTRPGKIANGVQLANDIDSVKRRYESRGYMEAEIRSDPEFNEEKSTVNYRLTVKENELYKMGELEIRGLDGRMTSRLEEQWKLHGGDPFNGDYPAQFVREALKQLQLMGDWKAGMHLGVNPKDKTVDVALSFERRE